MSITPIRIYQRQDKTLVDAILHSELKPNVLVDVEKEWGPIRLAAARKHNDRGAGVLPVRSIDRHRRTGHVGHRSLRVGFRARDGLHIGH